MKVLRSPAALPAQTFWWTGWTGASRVPLQPRRPPHTLRQQQECRQQVPGRDLLHSALMRQHLGTTGTPGRYWHWGESPGEGPWDGQEPSPGEGHWDGHTQRLGELRLVHP